MKAYAIYTRYLIAGIAALLITDCAKPIPNTGPAALPSTWPLAELTIPPGVQRAKVISRFESDSDDGYVVDGKVCQVLHKPSNTAKTWVVSFYWGQHPNELFKYIEDEISENNWRFYRDLSNNVGAGKGSSQYRHYVSNSSQYEIEVTYYGFRKPSEVEYVLFLPVD
jgi:hypothetical protein